jgi:cell division protein FtsW (lipid II flippase)
VEKSFAYILQRTKMTAKEFCSRTVGILDEGWGLLGWLLFLGLLFAPFMLMRQPDTGTVVVRLLMIFTLAWWVIDAVEQEKYDFILVAFVAVFLVRSFPSAPYFA